MIYFYIKRDKFLEINWVKINKVLGSYPEIKKYNDMGYSFDEKIFTTTKKFIRKLKLDNLENSNKHKELKEIIFDGEIVGWDWEPNNYNKTGSAGNSGTHGITGSMNVITGVGGYVSGMSGT